MKYIFLIICMILYSCEYRGEPAGSCDSPPKLSKNKLSFSTQGGVDSVFIEEAFWWIESLTSYQEGCKFILTTEVDSCNDNYCGSGEITRIECSWFDITKTSDHTLLVSTNQNETREEKNHGISIRSGNCVSGLLITQATDFSLEKLKFNIKGGIDSIVKEGKRLRVEEYLTIGDTIIALLSKNSDSPCLKEKPSILDGKIYICRSDIPFTAEDEDIYWRGITYIEYPWFTINKPSKEKIIFSVNENKTGKERKFGIRIDAGDYWTNVWGNQSAD